MFFPVGTLFNENDLCELLMLLLYLQFDFQPVATTCFVHVNEAVCCVCLSSLWLAVFE